MTKRLLRGQGLDLQDDKSTFPILDSLRSSDPRTRAFYFWVVSRALHYSDGYFGEAVSTSTYALYDTMPCEFLGHFVRSECITPEELDLWSSGLGFEFFLREDDIKSGKFQRVKDWVQERCARCSQQERKVAERILQTIKSDTEAGKNDP